MSDENEKPIPEETVRIMRVYVFEGPRKKIEEQLARSLGDGTRIVGGRGSQTGEVKIHVATIGSVAQIMPATLSGKYWTDPPGTDPIQLLGGKRVYVIQHKHWANGREGIREVYKVAVNLSADLIGLEKEHTEDQSMMLYSIQEYRNTFHYAFPEDIKEVELDPDAAEDAVNKHAQVVADKLNATLAAEGKAPAGTHLIESLNEEAES